MRWYNGSNIVTNATKDGIGAGKFNTERIIAIQDPGMYAAQICANYQGGNYGDWYLPSKYELNLLYQQKSVIGGFSTTIYWSSTELDIDNTWVQSFSGGSQFFNNKNLIVVIVRAVRSF